MSFPTQKQRLSSAIKMTSLRSAPRIHTRTKTLQQQPSCTQKWNERELKSRSQRLANPWGKMANTFIRPCRCRDPPPPTSMKKLIISCLYLLLHACKYDSRPFRELPPMEDYLLCAGQMGTLRVVRRELAT